MRDVARADLFAFRPDRDPLELCNGATQSRCRHAYYKRRRWHTACDFGDFQFVDFPVIRFRQMLNLFGGNSNISHKQP